MCKNTTKNPHKMQNSQIHASQIKPFCSVWIHLILLAIVSMSQKVMRAWLEVATEIVIQLQLQTIPHFTTLQKAAARLSDILLHVAIGRFIQNFCPGKIFADADATRFETRHAAPYCTYRCSVRHAFTKCSAGSDMKTQLICAVVIGHHPISHDIKHFPQLFSQMIAVTPMWIMVLDKGL